MIAISKRPIQDRHIISPYCRQSHETSVPPTLSINSVLNIIKHRRNRHHQTSALSILSNHQRHHYNHQDEQGRTGEGLPTVSSPALISTPIIHNIMTIQANSEASIQAARGRVKKEQHASTAKGCTLHAVYCTLPHARNKRKRIQGEVKRLHVAGTKAQHEPLANYQFWPCVLVSTHVQMLT